LLSASLSNSPERVVFEQRKLVSLGAPRGNRTPNPLIKSQLLCLLS
jgi:hypothetical protein